MDAKDSQADETLEKCKFLWDEYTYRHDLIWQRIFRFTTAIVLISIVPYIREDSACLFGPWIVTELDPTELAVVCRVNGRVKQEGSSRDIVFKIPQIIEYISAAMTLEPGDVVLTGTPEGVSPIRSGDQVEIEIEGVGVLRNPVIAG